MNTKNEPSTAFDETKAIACEPYRHEPTARTVAYQQPGANGETHLFVALAIKRKKRPVPL